MKAIHVLAMASAALFTAQAATNAQDCVWRAWAASWSDINSGDDLFPPNNIYNPTNWDYSFSQQTVMGTTQDTPDASTYALHWFLDGQPPTGVSNKDGSGGVYQEITVTAGTPLKYSFWWKGATTGGITWYEFMLIDGPFTITDADSGGTAPWIMRKRENVTFGWQQLTDESGLHVGSGGPTITPTGTTVTVVLKAGRSGGGGLELFFDDVQVWQDTGPNLLTNGDFENSGQIPPCDDALMWQDNSQGNYWLNLDECPLQHTTATPVTPATNTNDADTVMIITGTNLEAVTDARLVPVDGGADLIASNISVGTGPNATSMTVTFPTTGATDGVYDVVTEQLPPCLVQVLSGAFTLECASPATITGISPPSATDPTGSEVLRVSGTNLSVLSGIALEFATDASVVSLIDTSLSQDGDDVLASINLACAPAGPYNVVGLREDGCRFPILAEGFDIIKTQPGDGCAWQPWAVSWSRLNLGPDLDPPNEVYRANNWDYTFSQTTNTATPQDTPDGSTYSLHWFLDGQPGLFDDGLGSGGVYQEIPVQAGIPMEYSFYWKGAAGNGPNWFEFLMIDGPFSLAYMDIYQESSGANNPYMLRKKELTDATFDWEQVTHLTPADSGPWGDRPQTITPTGTVVTVVLKAGRGTDGGMESFWDNVVVTQNSGANLITNGDFENVSQGNVCNGNNGQTFVFQDICEDNYWLRSSFVEINCPDPFADADEDGDVDQDDFAVFQRCYTGSDAGPIATECICFDRPLLSGDNSIDAQDLIDFEACASGPDIPADITCDD